MQAAEFEHAIGDWTAELPHQRMRVYRNNVAAALVNALKVRFPVTEQLVGQEFFAAMALAYGDRHRPVSPVLIEYGSGLPDFIRNFQPAQSVPYLGDAAELEVLWWRAYHAADQMAPTPAALMAIDVEQLGGMHFALHGSVGLVQSPFAVAGIWQAHHGGVPMSSLKLDEGQCVLVARPLTDVSLTVIAPPRFAFLAALKAGAALADAVERTADQHPDFDTAENLRWFFSTGIATGFSA